MIEYWGRVLGAFLLIKVASALVKDAEKLITANAQARKPELPDLQVEATEVIEDPTSSTPDIGESNASEN